MRIKQYTSWCEAQMAAKKLIPILILMVLGYAKPFGVRLFLSAACVCAWEIIEPKKGASLKEEALMSAPSNNLGLSLHEEIDAHWSKLSSVLIR
jgi:hypothetical protein